MYYDEINCLVTGGSELLNGVAVVSTTSTPLPTIQSTTPGLLVSGFGTTNFTVQAGTRVSLLCQVEYLADNATSLLKLHDIY
ncbi:hypothetical protein O3M35_012437 [Rhynocoris fuscipes]|uniref:Ig-like domain-containing protein n=1 Tax=Rhynocoris fuscipes TaxID=488301 RepID=A0AAW1CTH1_9HEMI